MARRQGLSRLLQAYKIVAEPCSTQQLHGVYAAPGSRAGLHCLASNAGLDLSCSGHSGWHSGRDHSAHSQLPPWILPHQARLASTSPVASSEDEVLEGSEPASDVQPVANESSFSPEAAADVSASISVPAADSSLDASSVLDAVGMAEADALVSALENVWPLNAGMQSLLLGIHSVTGLPW